MSGSETQESDRSEEDIRAYARDIGIDPETEPELMCLAREAIFARLPPGWAESKDESGNPIFHNHYLQTTTNEHPCKVQYRKMVIQERERIQRSVVVGSSLSQLDKKENEDANNTHTGLFCSGFLSVIGSKCEETSSQTLPSFDDEDDGSSENQDSGGTVSGDQAEMSKSEMLDKTPSGDQSSDSPLQQLTSDISISCDSRLETDEKDGENEATDAAKGPDESGHDSSVEDNSASLDHECNKFADPRAKEDQEKEELIKTPVGLFCSGFLSVLSSMMDESSSTPSSRDDEDNAIFEKEDSRSTDADLLEQPQMQDISADHSTDSEQQLGIDVKEEDEETEGGKSLDESQSSSAEKGRLSLETHGPDDIQMPSVSSSGAEKDKQVQEAPKTLMDNNTKHTAKIALEWLHDNSMNVLERVSQRSALNLIQHLWRDLKIAVY
ncbi:centrosomal protein of 164 kDa-like [Hippocampus zosterae]|uniref:centrosomal protein of 164 kDa-like n=1 Tax=Hippocampus zosterae TaxID=109293 RepID=UPI00223CE866|nr:centrosomal protein of 164 kDa-like [Hippocampus zosterae]